MTYEISENQRYSNLQKHPSLYNLKTSLLENKIDDVTTR